MRLTELSIEYAHSAQLCKTRIAELKARLETEEMCEIDRLRLRRRIGILTGMMRDTMAVSKYLKNYYGGKEYGGEEA